MPRCDTSILLFADTGFGKTVQVGLLAEMIYQRTKQKTRLYTSDGGGWRSIQPYVDLGVIEAVDCTQFAHPWEWLDAVTQGKMPDGKGRWIPSHQGIGLWVYEGVTSFSDVLMADMSAKSGQGINIGGKPSVTFMDGQRKVSGSTEIHFGEAQRELARLVTQSQQLPGCVLWTAMARRADDSDTNMPILGPQAAGKKLTSDIPRWFMYTFRLHHIPKNLATKEPAQYRLYFDKHADLTVPGVTCVGNSRRPLDAPPLPDFLDPASLPAALDLINALSDEARAAVSLRLKLAYRPPTPKPVVTGGSTV